MMMMMSVNQMSVYHTLVEAYNVVEKTSSEKIRRKIEDGRKNVDQTFSNLQWRDLSHKKVLEQGRGALGVTRSGRSIGP